MNSFRQFTTIALLIAPFLALAPHTTADDAAAVKRLEQALGKVKTYEFGQSRKPLSAATEAIREACRSPEGREAVEQRLIAVLQTDATFDCKQFICQRLSEMGTEKSVPVLAKMLTDEKLSNTARFALQRISSPRAGEALRTALGSLTNVQKIGVINSLAERRDRQAVPDLAKLAVSQDAALAAAAISALGQIGGQEAAKLLTAATVADGLNGRRADALLRCADQMARDGQTEPALTIYNRLISKRNSTEARIGALEGLVCTEKEKALPKLLPLLKDDNTAIRIAAAEFAAKIPGQAATKSLAEQLPSLPPDAQVVLLAALTARGDKAAAPAVAKLVEGADGAVRVAALRTLGALGGAPHVMLLAKASAADGTAGRVASESLALLTGDGVDEAMVKDMKGAVPAIRVALINSLVARDYDGVVPVLFGVMKEREPSVHKAACKALGSVAGKKELPQMVDLLASAKSSSARRNLERAIGDAAARIQDPNACADPVVVALSSAGDEAKVSLLVILHRIGGPTSLAAINSQLTSGNPAVRKAAIQALAEWPDPAPIAELLKIAKTDPNEVHQILALRGYIRQVTMLSKRPIEKTVAMLREAMDLAKRPEEEKAILAVLPNYPCAEALALAESCLNDEQVAAEAKFACKQLKRTEGQKFDFQGKGAPVREGFIEVNASTLYDGQRGYGWLKAPSGERDRKKGTKLTRDFVFDRDPRTFRVKVENGMHVVTVFLGDMAASHDNMEVLAEGQPGLQKVTNKRGEVKELFFDVHVGDGLLDIEFRDGGGKDPNWTCAGLIVAK